MQILGLSFLPMHGHNAGKHKNGVKDGLYFLKADLDNGVGMDWDKKDGQIGTTAFSACIAVATGYVMFRTYKQLSGISTESKGGPISIDGLPSAGAVESGAMIRVISNKNASIQPYLAREIQHTNKNKEYRMVRAYQQDYQKGSIGGSSSQHACLHTW